MGAIHENRHAQIAAMGDKALDRQEYGGGRRHVVDDHKFLPPGDGGAHALDDLVRRGQRQAQRDNVELGPGPLADVQEALPDGVIDMVGDDDVVAGWNSRLRRIAPTPLVAFSTNAVASAALPTKRASAAMAVSR